jgi:hypothetical protein
MDTTPVHEPITIQVTLDTERLPADKRHHFAARATLNNETAQVRLARLITKALGGNDSPFTVRPA